MPNKDILEKVLVGYNDVFADIVNGLLFYGHEVVKGTELEKGLPREPYPVGETWHDQERDVIKYWKNGEIRLAVLGMENQTAVDYDLPLKVIGRDGVAYIAQVNNVKGVHWQRERYPVVTIVLYFGKGHWTGPKSLKECLVIPDELDPYVNDYRVIVCEVGQMTQEELSRFNSDFRLIAEYLVSERKGMDFDLPDQKVEHVTEVLGLLKDIVGDERLGALKEKVEKEGGNSYMRSWVIDQLEAKGEVRGRTEEKRKIAERLVIKNYGSVADVMEVTGLSKEEVLQIKKKVEAN